MEKKNVAEYLREIEKVFWELDDLMLYTQDSLAKKPHKIELLKKYMGYLGLLCSKLPDSQRKAIKKYLNVDLDFFIEISKVITSQNHVDLGVIYDEVWQLTKEWRGFEELFLRKILYPDINFNIELDSCEVFDDPELNPPEVYQVEEKEIKTEIVDGKEKIIVPWLMEEDPDLHMMLSEEFKMDLLKMEDDHRKEHTSEKIYL